MARQTSRTDLFRVSVSTAIAAAVTIVAVFWVAFTTDLGSSSAMHLVVVSYVTLWPVYTAIYVGWSARVYTRLSGPALRRIVAEDARDDQSRLRRALGESTVNTSISAASVAVVVTVFIAVQPDFRGDVLYVALALLTVASSWILMAFSFAQAYMRIGILRDGSDHIRMDVEGPPIFGDFVTLAVLVSTMAATTPARIVSRRAWRLVRSNVIVAFVFNSVILAMMVSLLFGGLLQ